jgi:hypothetical protein
MKATTQLMGTKKDANINKIRERTGEVFYF